MSFKSYKLGDIYNFSSGLSKSRSEFGFGHPFVTFKDVFYNYFIPSELSELANTTDKEIEKFSVKRGDVFLTRTSETLHELGQSSVALKDYPNTTFNGFTKRLRPNGKIIIHPEYIGYYFRSPNFRAEVTSMAVMTTRASLNNEIMAKLRVKLPVLEEQRAIGNILKSLDDKIEVNNKINQKLEEMAQTIFKQWFIDFDFPNEEGKPYKSSGGKMVKSELGMIPKGWEVKSLSNIANYLNGLAMQKFRPETEVESLKVMKIKELRQGKVDENSDLCCSKIDEKYIIEDGEIIFSWSGSLLVDIWCGGRCGLNQHLFKVTSDNYSKWFYYLWTKHHLNEFIKIAEGKATTMGHIKRSDLESAKVVIADKKNMIEVGKILDNIIEKIIKCKCEIKKLEKLRDMLLPKLMSGEIRVLKNN